ncbi:MAG: hypothetical protein OXQ31_09760 [Spirochaetaceae bacterium]|nr:hypothetical protein [Spirochaetaceae bacterium]
MKTRWVSWVGLAAFLVVLSACERTTPAAGAGETESTKAIVRVFTIAPGDVTLSADGTIGTVLWPMAELTQAVFNDGVVVAHWRYRSSASGWRSLPDVFQWSDRVVATKEFVYAPGSVGLQISSIDPTSARAAVANAEGGTQLRVAVWPG